MSDPRQLPKVDLVAAASGLAAHPEEVRTKAARAAVGRLRAEGFWHSREEALEAATRLAIEEAQSAVAPSLRKVINASGVILHTGAGRARIAQEAAQHVALVAMGYSNVEYDLDTGKRGDRQSHVCRMLTELTEAEDAFVVNNNAAAVFLALRALAFRKEVILSRGQMVEIGGSFRMPDIVKQSGCKLIEIGSTNRTRIEDYEGAITPRTAAILRCHPSNFSIVGFTEEVAPSALAELANKAGLLLIDDVGSGCLVDTKQFGLPEEPTLSSSVRAGAHLVTASGDKMLGGPQAGILVGTSTCVTKIRRHPLARAVRIDKLSLAALEATLRLYTTGQAAKIPTIRYMSRDLEAMHREAQRLHQAYRGESTVEQGITEIGSGSLPNSGVKTFRVGLRCSNAEALSAELRRSDPPIITRIENGRVWLDPRTLDPDEVDVVEARLRALPAR